MKLTIFTYIYKRQNNLKNFIENLKKQKSQNFEIIFMIDIPTDSDLKILLEYKSLSRDSIKIITNTKRQNPVSMFVEYSHLANGEYLSFVESNVKLDPNYVANFESINPQVDIIEFKPKFQGIVNWVPRSRLTNNEPKEQINGLVYTFPIIFNKFFKKELFEKQNNNNVRFWLEETYELFAVAQSYQYFDNFIIKSWIGNEININSCLREWKKIISNFELEHSNLMEEIHYAKLYFFQLYLPIILGTIISKYRPLFFLKRMLMKKTHAWEQKLNNLRHIEFENTLKNNKYLNIVSKETQTLTKLTPLKKWFNLHHEF